MIDLTSKFENVVCLARENNVKTVSKETGSTINKLEVLDEDQGKLPPLLLKSAVQ